MKHRRINPLDGIDKQKGAICLLDQFLVPILAHRSGGNIWVTCKVKMIFVQPLLTVISLAFHFPTFVPFSDLFLFHIWFSSFISPQNYLLWNMITSSLFNFFKSFIDSFRFAFLFQESKECFQIPPIVLQKPPFSYHISNQTLVLKYLSFLIDFGVLMFWQKFLRRFFFNYYL